MYVKRICTHIIKIRDKSYSVFFFFYYFPWPKYWSNIRFVPTTSHYRSINVQYLSSVKMAFQLVL